MVAAGRLCGAHDAQSLEWTGNRYFRCWGYDRARVGVPLGALLGEQLAGKAPLA